MIRAMFMSNANYYGGAGGAVLSFTANPGDRDIATHDSVTPSPSWPMNIMQVDAYAAEKANMTAQSSASLVKHGKAWIGGTVGVFQHCCGGMSASWYKPTTSNCKMELLGKPFCPVCGEAIYRIDPHANRTDRELRSRSRTGQCSAADDLICFDPADEANTEYAAHPNDAGGQSDCEQP
jgi:hypothetical protein